MLGGKLVHNSAKYFIVKRKERIMINYYTIILSFFKFTQALTYQRLQHLGGVLWKEEGWNVFGTNAQVRLFLKIEIIYYIVFCTYKYCVFINSEAVGSETCYSILLDLLGTSEFMGFIWKFGWVLRTRTGSARLTL